MLSFIKKENLSYYQNSKKIIQIKKEFNQRKIDVKNQKSRIQKNMIIMNKNKEKWQLIITYAAK